MKKRRTEQEINDIKVFAEEVGLDRNIASLCKHKSEVERIFELQKEMTERKNTYLHLKHIAPKERTKEYEAAIKHKEELAAYLYDSGQLEALATLREVEIKENEPRAQNYINRNKQFLTEELDHMYFISRTNRKEIVNILLMYLQGKDREHNEYPSGSIYKQVRKQIAEGKGNPIIDN